MKKDVNGTVYLISTEYPKRGDMVLGEDGGGYYLRFFKGYGYRKGLDFKIVAICPSITV